MGKQTGRQGVVPTITDGGELSVPALLLPVPSLAALRLVRPITTGTARVCRDLQITCCFTIAIIHSLTLVFIYLFIYFAALLPLLTLFPPPMSDSVCQCASDATLPPH